MNGNNSFKSVLLVEDDTDIADIIRIHLSDAGYQVTHLADGKAGCNKALSGIFDLLILDLNLPGMDGLEICRIVRNQGLHVPILMLTARTQEPDKVIGLDAGADDYMSKPFGVLEFLARVKALLRRAELNKPEKQDDVSAIVYRNLEIDCSKRKVVLNNSRLDLTPKEFDLLCFLARHPGVTYDRKTLLNQVWGHDFEGYEHTVNTHINRLRAKIETDPDNPEFVLTTWGIGYRFNDQ